MQKILWSERLKQVRAADKKDVKPEFKSLVHDIWMMRACQQNDQRSNTDNWMAQALEAAYNAGKDGKSPQALLDAMRGATPVKTRIVRRTTPAPELVEEVPATRVVRRRSRS